MIPLNIPPEILIGAPLVTLALLFYQSVYRLLRKEILRLEMKVKSVEGRLTHTETEIDHYRQQVSEQRAQLGSATERNAGLVKEVHKMSLTIIELKATIDQQNVLIATLTEELKKKGLRIEALQLSESEGNNGE